MQSSSHAHPLSPPLSTASLPFDLPTDSRDSRSNDDTSPAASTKPLFPPSPTASQHDEAPISTSSPSTAIGLGFPSVITGTRSDGAEDSRAASPLPDHLTFPAPPHLLPSTSLTALPLSHLVALAQSLSRDLALAQADLTARRKELEALERLATGKGASSGEIERVKVRIRTEEPRSQEGEDQQKGNTLKWKAKKGDQGQQWRIELDVESRKSSETARVEVDLDIEDLTEAISSNAFDIATSPVLDAEESHLRNRTMSLPPIPPPDLTDRASISTASTSPSVQSTPVPLLQTSSSSTIKPSRGRHASLSARFFGSLIGSTTLPPPAPASPSNPTNSTSTGESTSFDPGLTPNIAQRNGRSGSIRSVNSVRSNSSRTSDTGSESSKKTSYSDWFGWKGWNGAVKGPTSLKAGLSPDEVPEEAGEEEGNDEREEEEERDDLATPVPDRSSEFFDNPADYDLATPTSRRARTLSDASQSIVESNSPRPTSSGQSSSSRRTSATRSTFPSAFADSSSSLSSTLSPPTMSTPDGKRSSPGVSPPDSPSTSRTRSPAPPPSLATRQAIVTPTLSTPMTTSTLSTPSLSSPRRPQPSRPSPQSSLLFDQPVNRIEGEATEADATRRNSVASAEHVETSHLGKEGNEEEEEADGQATLKARTHRTGSVPANFVPGIPIYSAPEDGCNARNLDQGYVAVAKGTIGRALGLGLSSTTGETAASTGMTRSASDGVRRALNDSSNFTRLPSLSLSRYSLFSPPLVPTPSTSVSIATKTSPAIVHATTFAPPPPSGSPTTMELDTISVEAAPPSLALLKPNSTTSQPDSTAPEEDSNEDGPLIDRYGFIYDVHSGMELLKENRRREKEKESQNEKGIKSRNKGHAKSKEEENDAKSLRSTEEAEPTGLATPTQLEVHPQLDAIREAMGLTPTSEAPNVFSPPAVESKSLDLNPVPPRPPKLVRAPSSDDSTLSRLSGPQSMRALLGQLRNMSDTVERTQQSEWDAFIRKRQTKLAKLKKQQQQQINALHEGSTSGKAKSRKERPKTIWGANALAEEKIEDSDSTREEAWTENLVGVAQMGTEGKSRKEDWNEFKELVRKGIPISYRPKIWGECSSANEAREPGVYQELLFSPREDEEQCLKQIDMDCHRTFPTNVFFAGNGPGVAKLRNVLVAYSRRNPKIGYCQGMNNLVATLLLTHPAEEDAFWVLVCIVENILPSDYYTSHLLVSRADQQVLNDLVARLLPSISEHLEEQGVELSAISFGWFLSLFTDVLPIQTLLRVWDLFFIHGTVLLFRVALSILKLHESELLACDSAAGLYGLLGSLPGHIYHADKLLKVACEDLASSVKDREIASLRRTHVAALQEELGIVVSDSD
ncbi:TBC domain-containing protein [Sporobolomyces salmoneus]|uniref:TBC domain-containing protein n=1 Tax=Sporobolomyces salmoneus TaxID=183962 RepID=UPI00316F3C64